MMAIISARVSGTSLLLFTNDLQMRPDRIACGLIVTRRHAITAADLSAAS